MIVYIQNNAAGTVEVERNVTHVRAFAGNKVEVVYARTRPWLIKATTYDNAVILTVKEEEKIMKKN